ncbi:MAG: ABC transporter ATP-binding protein YtrB [Firmicutes bacterium]|nr:ABC transporter ATP-binding protein YtrB [Bacillota bacterium]
MRVVVKEVSKDFGGHKALGGVSFEVQPGAVFGIVGPNGAGKTTLLRTIMGLIEPSSGVVAVDGANPRDGHALRATMGYLADAQPYYPDFTVSETIRFYRDTYRTWQNSRCQELCAGFGLPMGAKVKRLSRGQRTQLGIVLNLSYAPKLLLLDEPTAGLDPVVRRQFLALLMDEVAQNGTTVLISSHQLGDIERICDYVGILHQGKLLDVARLEDLKRQVCTVQSVFEQSPPSDFWQQKWIISVKQHGRIYTVVAQGDREVLASYFAPFRPQALEFIDMPLEDIFIARMGGEGYAFKQVLAE